MCFSNMKARFFRCLLCPADVAFPIQPWRRMACYASTPRSLACTPALQACHKSGKDDLSRVRNTPAVSALFIYLLRTRLMLADFPPLPCGLFRACTPNATSTVGGRRKTDRDPCCFLRHKQRDLAILESGPTASTTQDASLGRKVACPGSIGVSISRACPSAMKRRRLFCAAMTKRL